MSVQFKTPNITGATDREKLVQIQSYLYQMAKQLQWAFDTIDTEPKSTGTTISNTGGKGKATASDSLATFAGLKNLIIKSADIVNAYYEQINRRLASVYVAQSDFGIYTEEAEQKIQENSLGISQLFTNEQIITDRVTAVESGNQFASERLDDLSASMKDVEANVEVLVSQSIVTNAYIKSGLLYYDDSGSPVYGLEIGQTNNVNGTEVFDKFARFTSDRLSFFDRNDVEVAYISDYKLYITNAEITGTLYLSGRFKIYYNNGLAFQWVGGEG